MNRIAFMTLGVLKQPVGHPEVQGFVDRLEANYAAAEGSAGFFARSIRDINTWEHSWGPVIRPRCTPQDLPLERYAMTLSLWENLEAVAAYAYHGVHAEALARRADWFVRGSWPAYVAWWVPVDHVPRWNEGTDRIDHLHLWTDRVCVQLSRTVRRQRCEGKTGPDANGATGSPRLIATARRAGQPVKSVAAGRWHERRAAVHAASMSQLRKSSRTASQPSLAWIQ